MVGWPPPASLRSATSPTCGGGGRVEESFAAGEKRRGQLSMGTYGCVFTFRVVLGETLVYGRRLAAFAGAMSLSDWCLCPT